jgi:hypothetical protein
VLPALRELLPRGGLARGAVVATAEFGLLCLALAVDRPFTKPVPGLRAVSAGWARAGPVPRAPGAGRFRGDPIRRRRGSWSCTARGGTSAWLKLYFPAAFTTALLRNQPMGFYAPHSLINDARRHGVMVRGVDVNASDPAVTSADLTA